MTAEERVSEHTQVFERWIWVLPDGTEYGHEPTRAECIEWEGKQREFMLGEGLALIASGRDAKPFYFNPPAAVLRHKITTTRTMTTTTDEWEDVPFPHGEQPSYLFDPQAT